MLPSQDLIGLLQEVRIGAQDPLYWDEVIAAVPDEQGLSLSLPEIAEAVHVWVRDCVRAEVDGSDIGSTCTSLVSLHASRHASPTTTAQAFSAWSGLAAPNSCESLPGISSSHEESEFTLTDGAESHTASVEDSSAAVADLAGMAVAGGSCPHFQQAEHAADILFRHATNSAKSAEVQEAKICLSAAHEAIGQILLHKAEVIEELHAEANRIDTAHLAELKRMRQLHKAEKASLLSKLAASTLPAQHSDGKCVLCLDGFASHASVPCGHLAFCGPCAAERPFPSCPVCRQPSQCVVRIFKP